MISKTTLIDPDFLSSAIANATATSISINANSDFVASNDGSNIYIKIGSEVIVGTISSTTITASTRGLEGTASSHANGSTVELYQLNGIPLTQINKTHIALANIDRKFFEILLSNIRLIFSLFIFCGFNFFTACSAAIDPSCLGFKISL